MIDRKRLAKILAMTASSHDHEALSAVRMANEILRGEGVSWEQVLSGGWRLQNVGETRWQHYRPHTARDDHDGHVRDHVLIDSMFEFAIPTLDPRQDLFRLMVKMRAEWKARGYLTRGEFNTLKITFEHARLKRSAGG